MDWGITVTVFVLEFVLASDRENHEACRAGTPVQVLVQDIAIIIAAIVYIRIMKMVYWVTIAHYSHFISNNWIIRGA